jgi:hypothetical protein
MACACAGGGCSLALTRTLRSMQLAFRSMLESLEPPISANSRWHDVSRAVSLDERMHLVPDTRQAEIFEELRSNSIAAEELRREQAKAEVNGVAVAGDAGGSAMATKVPGASSGGGDDMAALSALRQEQVRCGSWSLHRFFLAERCRVHLLSCDCCACCPV